MATLCTKSKWPSTLTHTFISSQNYLSDRIDDATHTFVTAQLSVAQHGHAVPHTRIKINMQMVRLRSNIYDFDSRTWRNLKSVRVDQRSLRWHCIDLFSPEIFIRYFRELQVICRVCWCLAIESRFYVLFAGQVDVHHITSFSNAIDSHKRRECEHLSHRRNR